MSTFSRKKVYGREIGERFKSYTPHAKERHGKGQRLSGLAGGKPLLLCLQSRDKHAPFTKLSLKWLQVFGWPDAPRLWDTPRAGDERGAVRKMDGLLG